ncbi:MAG: MATE family efflux transporter [Wenyingzhuangia sp.]|jgi:multidrug resistance protein, MATE family|uniref:MATE family efflux transporter n=1 Tax=Wenyingzhuangia sp. TaxID=1964193 RepID=UPI00321A93ED
MNVKKYTSEFKTNINLAVPVMLGQLGHVLVGFADNIMVGELGAPSLAAISLSNAVFFILMGIGVGFSFALTPLISEADATKKYIEGKKNYQHGVVLLTALGVILSIILLSIEPLLSLIGQPMEVVKLAIPYYRVLAFSMIPLLIFQAIKQFTDGLSLTKYAMVAILSANVVNIVLNYVLIYGKFGAPSMGTVGAAYGTLFSRVLMILILLFFISRRKKFQPYKIKISWLAVEKERMIKIFRLGYPNALQMFFEIGIFASAVLLSGMIGTEDQAANQIALNLSTMTFMVATGVAVATTIRVGNQKGLKAYKNLKVIALSNVFLMIIIAVFAAVGFITLRIYLPKLYIDDQNVVSIASQLLIIAGLFQISDGIQVVVLGALRGLQDMFVPMCLVFVSYWVVGFPICYYLGIMTSLETLGIWLGLLISLTVSATLLYLRFQHLTKRLLLS